MYMNSATQNETRNEGNKMKAREEVQREILECLARYPSADVFCIEQWCGFPYGFADAFAGLCKRGDIVSRVRRTRFGSSIRYTLKRA